MQIKSELGNRTLIILVVVVMFLASLLAVNPEASAANPTLAFLQTTILDLLNSISGQITAVQTTLDDPSTGLAEIKDEVSNIEQRLRLPLAGEVVQPVIARVLLEDLSGTQSDEIDLTGFMHLRWLDPTPDTTPDPNTETLQVEIVSMLLTGSSPIFGDVTLQAISPSTGTLTQELNGRNFVVDSFFDVEYRIDFTTNPFVPLESLNPIRHEADSERVTSWPSNDVRFETTTCNGINVPGSNPADPAPFGLCLIKLVPTTDTSKIIKDELIGLEKKLADLVPPPPVEICDDGIDNDGDGLVDIDDPDCEPEPDPPGEE